MTHEERQMIARWVMNNVDETDVPADEGLGDGLRYNLVSLALCGRPYRKYDYKPDQDGELVQWEKEAKSDQSTIATVTSAPPSSSSGP